MGLIALAHLFVGGVMNVLWIATISAFVLIEKMMPVSRLICRIAGAGFVAAGTWLVVGLHPESGGEQLPSSLR